MRATRLLTPPVSVWCLKLYDFVGPTLLMMCGFRLPIKPIKQEFLRTDATIRRQVEFLDLLALVQLFTFTPIEGKGAGGPRACFSMIKHVT